ncbi:hypothetical protein [Parvularcula sp. IMCC14364]|uniref:hypothetical protein n=1 Tax=Parvularcula sp. IMCC14364 TaxID=3067902 RepID=UPI0027425157|nr:hypothetical protein [Parvularcula sp. IMCC14364]
MKFFQSKKKITTRDFRATPADPTSALKQELDAAIVPTLRSRAKTSDEISETTKVIKKAEPVKKAAAEAPAEASAAVEKAPAADVKTEAKGDEAERPSAATTTASAAQIDNMRLFPGFEDQGFEVGYAVYNSQSYGLSEKAPMLLMRWKSENAESDWFPIPPMFNKVLLARIHERDHDLDRLLLDYGYDADQLASARKSQS